MLWRLPQKADKLAVKSAVCRKASAYFEVVQIASRFRVPCLDLLPDLYMHEQPRRTDEMTICVSAYASRVLGGSFGASLGVLVQECRSIRL